MSFRRTISMCALVLAAGLVAHDGYAAGKAWHTSFTITNNSGAAKSGLDLNFFGTGGGSTLSISANAPGCPAPSVSNLGTPWAISWGGQCVDPGESITVQITGGSGAVAFSNGSWSPGNVPLFPGDVQLVSAVSAPSLSGWGLALLGVLLATAGSIWLERRTSLSRGAARAG